MEAQKGRFNVSFITRYLTLKCEFMWINLNSSTANKISSFSTQIRSSFSIFCPESGPAIRDKHIIVFIIIIVHISFPPDRLDSPAVTFNETTADTIRQETSSLLLRSADLTIHLQLLRSILSQRRGPVLLILVFSKSAGKQLI